MGIYQGWLKRFGIWGGVLCIFVASQTAVFAQGNLKLGRLAVTPSLKYELRYDDNVFIEATNEQDDVVHILSPGILFGYAGSTPGNFFQAGYTGDFALHMDLTDNDWQRHSPFFTAGYESPMGFYVKGGDSFSYSEDPFGSFNELDQSNRFGLGEKTKRFDNTANILLGYRFADRWFTEGYYKNYLIRYDASDDQWQDRLDHTLSGAMFYRITPRTSAMFEYRYTGAEYNEQNDGIFDPGRSTSWSSGTSQDYVLHDFLLGVRFDPGGKISGEAKIGWGIKDFDNQVDPLGFTYEDDDTWIASTYVSYTPTTRSTVSLNFQRSHLGSPDADASSFINTLIQLSGTYQFAYRLTANGLVSWNNDDYQNENPGRPNKYFDRYSIKIGLDWQPKPWIKTGVYYQWEDQGVSNEAAYGTSEYTRNVVAAVVQLTY